mmetsp:Transcript_36162/g.94790  ORF Transcript_36162/g.94790 Transcript_36162/m.94790 type:complete len:755 (-) Transcript_36162:57-2321(-)
MAGLDKEVDRAMTAAIEADDTAALRAVLELRPNVDKPLSNLSIEGAADGESGVRGLQLACHRSSWACANELIRHGADGMGCSDADGDCALLLAIARGESGGWAVARAILEAEARRHGVAEPTAEDAAALYREVQRAPRTFLKGMRVVHGTAAERWTRMTTKGLALHSVFFSKLHDAGPYTPGLVDTEKILRVAARCGLPLPSDDTPEAQKMFSYFVSACLETPGAPGPLAVLTQLGMNGCYRLDSIFSRDFASVWHVAANCASPAVIAAIAHGGRDGIDTEDGDKHAPLELACYGNQGDEGTAVALIKAGANPNRHCTLNDIHPLELALAHRNWYDFGRALLGHNAKMPQRLATHICGERKMSALEVVLSAGLQHRMKPSEVGEWAMQTLRAEWPAGLALLLLSGVDPNWASEDTGRSLLHVAALNGLAECCRILMGGGADMTLIAPTGISEPSMGTPLLFAINASEWTTAALLAKSDDADAALNDGKSASAFVKPAEQAAWRDAVERALLTEPPVRSDLEMVVTEARSEPEAFLPQRSTREESRLLIDAHTRESVQAAASLQPADPGPAVAAPAPAPPPVERAGGDVAGSLDDPEEPVYEYQMPRQSSVTPTPSAPPVSRADRAPRRESAPAPASRPPRCGYPASCGRGTCLIPVTSGTPHCPRHTCNEDGCSRGKPSREERCSDCEKKVSVQDDDDDTLCVVCLENPKTALLQHGADGHLCCCLACAKLLKARQDDCPMCRKPIDAVIQVFS